MALFVLTLSLVAVPALAQDEGMDFHAPKTQMHFSDTEMEFAFALIVGATMNHGCEIGEAFLAVSNIEEGNAASWQQAWIDMADKVRARGEASLDAGHEVSAREQFQRAAYYYRAALISMLPEDERFEPTALAMRSLLRQAGRMMDPPLEYFEIPYEDTVLPGYFRAARTDRGPASTLMMIGGGETFAEDLVFYIMPQAHEHGYNFLTVDLPGQGLLPMQGYVFRHDMDVPMRPVADYALSRPETDPAGLVAFGISGGGGFVPMAAQHDDRIRAIAMSSAVVDAYPLFADMPVVTATDEEAATWSSFRIGSFRAIGWRWGVEHDLHRLAEVNRGFTFDPEQISCPGLMVVGEGEYANEEVARQQRICLEGLADPRSRLVVTPAAEGASNHCITENRSIVSQVVFDWFDEVLGR